MKHEVFEKNSLILLIGILVVVSIGGIVQIAPLFWVESTIEKVLGMRPYTPLEQAGRDIYMREGCYGCHSQMIRTLRDEVERYGPHSPAVEAPYDQPMPPGSDGNGAEPGAPVRAAPAAAASIPSSGMLRISTTRATWCRNPTCPPIAGWRGRRS